MVTERYYTRIKRGMIFWYNIDPTVNKYDVPELRLSETKTAKDYLEYGDRPWLLVSVDERNVQGKTCTIVPLCTNTSADKDRFHVPIRYKGKDALILCEHMTTVNCIELIKYECTLEESTMKLVEDAMREYLGIHDDPLAGLASNEVVGRLEGIINEIVKKKIEEERKKVTQVVDVDDAVLRISEGLENLFDIGTKSVVEEKSEPEVAVSSEFLSEQLSEDTAVKKMKSTTVKKGVTKKRTRTSSNKSSSEKRSRNMWDKSSAIAFMQEAELNGGDVVAVKYGYADAQSVRKTICYLRHRFNITNY